MFYLILIILLVVGTLGVATYGGVMLLQSTQNITDTQANARRLEMVAWNLRNSGAVNTQVVSGSGGVFPRYEGAVYNSITAPDPALFATPFTMNGINFQYCPYTTQAQSGTAVAIQTPGGSNDYKIKYNYLGTSSFNQKIISQTRNSADSANVTVDTHAQSDTMQLVTMPSAGSTTPPQCNALGGSTATNILTATGGSVVAVTARQAWNEQIYSAAKIMSLYVAPATTGDGSGRDVNNYTTLDNAMNIWRAVQPRTMIINFSASTSFTATSATMATANVVNPTTTQLALGNPTGMKLIWVGAGSGSTTVTPTADPILNYTLPYNVDLPVDFEMKGLTFGANTTDFGLVEEKGGNLIIDDVKLNLQKVILKGGNLTSMGGASIATAQNAMDINPASILSLNAPFTYSGSAARGIYLYGGEIHGNSNGALTVYAPNGGDAIYIRSGMLSSDGNIDVYPISGALARGMIIAPAGQVTINQQLTVHSAVTTAAVDVAGFFSIANSGSLLTPDGAAAGVRLVSGGEFNNNGTIGSSNTPAQRPTIGVYDLGGTKISGGLVGTPGNVYATGNCWSGAATPNLFSSSPAEANGSYSTSQTGISDGGSGNYNFLTIDNKSVWLCTR